MSVIGKFVVEKVRINVGRTSHDGLQVRLAFCVIAGGVRQARSLHVAPWKSCAHWQRFGAIHLPLLAHTGEQTAKQLNY